MKPNDSAGKLGFACWILAAISVLAAPAELRVPLTAAGGEVNDRVILADINRHTARLMEANATVRCADMLRVPQPKQCKLELRAAGREKITAAETLRRSRAGVLIISNYYKCNRCPNWHSGVASGFMLTADGAFCTSYHVLENQANETLVIVTGDGRVAPVVELLAADPVADLVILRAAGKGFTPLPVAAAVEAGDKIRVLSHPDSQFYVFSEGIVSRRFVDIRPAGQRSMLAITADFAKGSSGAPVFDETGAVVASVNNTRSTYYNTTDKGVNDNLQMVFKNCVSTRHLLEMVRGK